MKNEKETVEEKTLEAPDPIITNGKARDESLPMNDVLQAVDEDLDLGDTAKANDYAHFTKAEFTELIKELAKESDFKKVDAAIRDIKPLYSSLRDQERSQALERFKLDGGAEEDFEFKGDEFDVVFEATLKLIRDRRNQFYKNAEEQKSDNLRKKEEILEKLRALADSEDTEHSFQQFKQLQNEWKSIGPVANSKVTTLWANYGALVDRFYDQRSIYFELKELDRKKNLEMKIELCQKAEHLVHHKHIQGAVRELNELHNEFKHIGPVPKEDKDALWQRFKAASDAVYAQRDSYIKELTGELQKNLEAKLVLGEELAPFATFQSDRIKDWNQKTVEILSIQKKWETVGAIPRTKSKDINKKFWTSFKAFFSNKNLFFKKLDEERDKNLQLKNEIIKKANELKDSTDWDKTANDLKELQRQWKEVGPVPEKFREKVFQEFKQVCDHFFEQRRTQFEKADRDQEENLRQKELICSELERLTTEKAGTLALLTELQNKFNNIGFVPRKSVTDVKNRFNAAVSKLMATLEISVGDKDRTMLEIQLNNLKNDPQAEVKIYHKEQVVRKRITKMENDIALLRNNLEFFGRSKNAEKLKEEFNEKLREATEQLGELKKQLKMLKTVSS
jgi:hypothetical protein